MKYYSIPLLFICGLLLLGSCKSQPVSEIKPLKVMSFNIRLDAASDGENNWKFRKNDVYKMLNYYQPDLLGMQEVCHNQMEDLKQAMTSYQAVGVGRDDGKQGGEYSPVFFNKKRFTLLKEGHFSLSETPDQFGVKGWDASYNRVATWAILHDKQNQNEFIYLNTHLDNDGKVARKEGIRLILNQIKQVAPHLPVILSGDFNCEPHEEPLQLLVENKMFNTLQTSDICYGPTYSFHDFGRLSLNQRVLLDYIFTSNEYATQRYRVIEDKPQNVYLSDHFPVVVDLMLKK